MKKNTCKLTIISIVTIALFHSTVWGNQIVKKQDREWAKTTIAQEKSLKTIPDKNTLAILYFKNQTGNREIDPFQKGIAIMLITDLSKIEKLTVVERTKIQALIDELKLSGSGIVDLSSAPKTGKLLGARYIIGGDFLKGNTSELKIDSGLLNIKHADTMETIISEGAMKELLALEKDLAFKIIKSLKIKLSQKEKDELKKPLSTNMRALSYYFTGIGLSDKGKYQMARRYYKRAVKLDPGFTMAEQAISELSGLKLVPKPPKTERVMQTTRNRVSTNNTATFDQRYKRSVSESSAVNELTNIKVKW